MNETQDWHTPQFRNRVVAQIEETIRQSGNPIQKNSREMESHVFQKAKSREEYLALVARLILHVKNVHNQKDKRMPGVMMPQGAMTQAGMTQGAMTQAAMTQSAMSQGGMAQGSMPGQPQLGPQDPINALTNMANKSGPPLSQQMGQPGMQQPPPQQIRLQHLIAQQQRVAQQQAAQQQAAQQQAAQQQAAQQQAAQQQAAQQQAAQQQAAQQQAAQQQAMQHGQVPVLHRQDAFIVTSPSQINQMSAPLPSYPVQPGSMAPRGPGQGQPMYIQGPQPGYTQTQGSVAPAAPSPSLQPGSHIPSPSSFMPNPSPQSGVSPSPSTSRSYVGAPSPSAPLNTPGNPGSVGNTASPAPHDPSDESAYLEKLKQLSVYIEPLRKMINRLQREGNAKKREVMKLTNLLEILSDPMKRLPMQTLTKCEGVLQRMDFHTTPATAAPVATPEQHMCQPLLEAVNWCMKSPLLNHTLQHTFSPAITAIHGPPIKAPSPPAKRKKLNDDDAARPRVPDTVQGEVARLGVRFKVSLDPAYDGSTKAIHLVCKLDDANLPDVPSIHVTVPESYPHASPYCNLDDEAYDRTAFLQNIRQTHRTYISQLPDNFSVTSLLDAWEMSVRQAFAPPVSAVA